MTGDAHFRLRLPQELHDKLRQAAAKRGKSINSEVVARLERSFEPVLSAVLKEDGEVVFDPDYTKRVVAEVVDKLISDRKLVWASGEDDIQLSKDHEK